MGRNLENLHFEEQEEEIQTQFYNTLIINILNRLPYPTEEPEDPTYALELSPRAIIQKTAKHLKGKEENLLEGLFEFGAELSRPGKLCDRLKTINEQEHLIQTEISITLRATAYLQPESGKQIWEVVADRNWRENVLLELDPTIQGMIFEALSVFMISNNNEWFWQWPHCVAEMCEIVEDEEQHRILFFYLLYTCLASETVSALKRLLRGDQRARYVDYIKEYRESVEAMSPHYPAWVQARLRGLIASLHVV